MKIIKVILVFISICLISNAIADEVKSLDARLTKVNYPYKVSYFSVLDQKQKLEMAYMDITPKKPNGQAILLLHGKNFNGSYWSGTIEELTNLGYKVIVPDQIGFGKSSKPKNFQYSFQQLAMNTHALVKNLGESNVIVLGHSIGGMLAIRYALMYPSDVSALVLEDPIGLEDWRLYIPYHDVNELYQAELHQTMQSMKKYQQTSYYHGTWKPEYDKILSTQYGWLKGPDYPIIAWNSALTTDMAFTQPVVYELPYIKMPTLLIIGDLDRTVLLKNFAPDDVKNKLGNYPVLANKAVATIPNAKLELIKGVGHIPHIESPEAFYAALVPFLKSH